MLTSKPLDPHAVFFKNSAQLPPAKWFARVLSGVSKMSKSQSAFEKAKYNLFNFSEQGATATNKEAAKILKPLSDTELEELRAQFVSEYAVTFENVPGELDADDRYYEDAISTVEDLHDRLKCVILVSELISAREEKAARKAA
jgi:hypothetical protein